MAKPMIVVVLAGPFALASAAMLGESKECSLTHRCSGIKELLCDNFDNYLSLAALESLPQLCSTCHYNLWEGVQGAHEVMCDQGAVLWRYLDDPDTKTFCAHDEATASEFTPECKVSDAKVSTTPSGATLEDTVNTLASDVDIIKSYLKLENDESKAAMAKAHLLHSVVEQNPSWQ